jgi:hypothetical protein
MYLGLALQNSKVPAVPRVLCGCVVAKEKPHALYKRNNKKLFGESPVRKILDRGINFIL